MMIFDSGLFVFKAFLISTLSLATAPTVYGQNNTIAGAVSLPFPTLENLSVEWLIEGDANLNGTVAVSFRKKGDSMWKEGMPLRRVPQ